MGVKKKNFSHFILVYYSASEERQRSYPRAIPRYCLNCNTTKVKTPRPSICLTIRTDLSVELAENKLGTHALDGSIVGVREMLSIDTLSVGSVADTIAVLADILGSGDPTRRNAVRASVLRDAVDVQSGSATGAVDVASQTGLVQRVTDEPDTLDGSVGGTGQLGESVDGGGSTLRVSLEDEALVGACAEGGGDLVDNVGGTGCGVLAVVGGVDGVVDLAT